MIDSNLIVIPTKVGIHSALRSRTDVTLRPAFVGVFMDPDFRRDDGDLHSGRALIGMTGNGEGATR